MKNVILYAGLHMRRVIVVADSLIDELRKAGVDIVAANFSSASPSITTTHVHVNFVNDLNKLKGRRFDEVFGEVPLKQYYLKSPEYGCTDLNLFDYILAVEGMKRQHEVS